MKDPLKPRDKITQKMTRDGAITENQTTGETERISKRTQDAELQKTPEQQAAQDAAQLQGAASPTSPLPHVPGTLMLEIRCITSYFAAYVWELQSCYSATDILRNNIK